MSEAGRRVSEAGRRVRVPLLRQSLEDVVFAHWPLDPAVAAPLLPPGIRPDTLHGRTYVGLVGVRMRGVGVPGLPAPPYLGTFAQVNVRLYGVGPAGEQGVVFLAMHAARLVPALVGRAAGLPYAWRPVSVVREGAAVGYDVRNYGALVVRAGPSLPEPSPTQRFLVERGGLFLSRAGRTWHVPLDHAPWPLHRAEPERVNAEIVRHVGIAVTERPSSVVWSAGVTARFGHPRLLRSAT
ncbi:MAG: YqjF family protein [Actinomycetes bacterium]